MPSTSAHIPSELLARLDDIAARRGTSRNRLIVEACELLAEEDRGEWPAGFFSNEDLGHEDLEVLRAGAKEMTQHIQTARRSRAAAPF